MLPVKSQYYHLQEAAGLQNIENQNLTLVRRSKWGGVVGVCSVVVLWVWVETTSLGFKMKFDFKILELIGPQLLTPKFV